MANQDGQRSKEKLKRYVEKEIHGFFGTILDYIEVAVDGEERFKTLRSKILNSGNDVLRNVKKELETSYDVNYIPQSEDIIKVK